MRNLAITAAIAALSLGATAAASPFSFSASADAERGEAKAESRGLIETVLESTASAFGMAFAAGDKHEDDITLRYYHTNEGCEAEETADAETEAEPEEKKALVGPEPIYFGF